jgi:hypothetical protein
MRSTISGPIDGPLPGSTSPIQLRCQPNSFRGQLTAFVGRKQLVCILSGCRPGTQHHVRDSGELPAAVRLKGEFFSLTSFSPLSRRAWLITFRR